MSEYKLMLDEEEVEIFKEILTLCSNEFKRDMIRKRTEGVYIYQELIKVKLLEMLR